MGLRDAIDAGRAEIRETAKSWIERLKIEQMIKNSVIHNENEIHLHFPSMPNLGVIHEEIVKQIESEGFIVDYQAPCCGNPDVSTEQTFVRKNRKDHNGRKIYFSSPTGYGLYCNSCGSWVATAKRELELPNSVPFYGSIIIRWEI